MKIFESLTDSKTGRFSLKRLAIFSSFYFAVAYAFTPILFALINCFFGRELNFEPKEFIFLALLGYSGYQTNQTVKDKNTAE